MELIIRERFLSEADSVGGQIDSHEADWPVEALAQKPQIIPAAASEFEDRQFMASANMLFQ
jgi:hypothetical protein